MRYRRPLADLIITTVGVSIRTHVAKSLMLMSTEGGCASPGLWPETSAGLVNRAGLAVGRGSSTRW